MPLRLKPLLPLGLIPTLLAGQASAQPDTELRVEPITVTASGLVRDRIDTPAAVSVVDEADLQSGRQHLQLDESLNRVPGTFFQNRYNFAQNLRLSIRGFGARAPFGVRGVRLRVDGIPETLPDGQSQVDTIDLETAEQVEVIRGPSSALYGNAAGGVVDVRTRSGPAEPYVQGRVTGGSYGFRRTGVMGGGQSGNWNGHASAWHMNYDGYRDQSETEKMMFNGKASYQFSPGRELTTVFTAYDQPKGQDPGGLTREQVREDRRQAGDQAEALGSGQTVEQQRLGFSFSDAESLPGELSMTGFYTRRDFEQQLPSSFFPSLIEFDRDFYGFNTNYTDDLSFLTIPVSYTVGFEVNEQRDDRQRFEVDEEGRREGQTQDAVETGTATGFFGQADLALTERLDLTLGARYDHLRLRIRDRFGDGAASGRETFDEFSVSIGPAYQLHRNHRLYANVSTAFESPTFTEFYDPTEPGEVFDSGLEPQQALNTELGVKGVLGQQTRYDLAVFRVSTDDEIVQFADGPDRFRNAGETRRDGIELGIEHFLSERFTVTGAYTWSDFRFRDYQDDLEEVNYRDNRLPGLPEHNLFAELAWQEPGGSFVALDTLIVSNVYADDANDERVSGYGVVNLRSGVTQQIGDREMEWFWGLNNLLDREYSANVRVNATGDRFFEPAPERNLHAGLRLTF